ncbi:hypothetical protein Tco_1003900 [Tanacetum coccineum]|uniref:Uncharacterized protein n=1 Tax=Tanacetum coccineum TaxID=301880 RepID=A0ABQ5FCP1_9ASTR
MNPLIIQQRALDDALVAPNNRVIIRKYNIMDGINIDNLTIEQYLRLTQENQAPSRVKKVDDMTIAE